MSNTPYADLEIRIRAREEQGYPVELTLNDMRIFRGGFLNPEAPLWTPPTLDAAVGRELLDLLLHDTQVRTAWDMIRGAASMRRIRMSIDASAPELHAIPWELMWEAGEGGIGRHLAASDATPFSRFIALPDEPGRVIAARPLRIAVAVASPSNLGDYPGNLAPINAALELATLRETLAGLPAELIEIPQPVTMEAIDAALAQGAHVLHLIAHGAINRQGRAIILLANRNNLVRHIFADEHAAMLALHARGMTGDSSLRLVFLASCQSATASPTDAFRSFAPRLVQSGVPAVVAMQDLVPVVTARAFTQTFYRQLLRHGQVDLAANQARSGLLAGRWPSAHVPVLFMRLTDGQLIAPNPARTALEAMLADPTFTFFDPINGDYIPLPVEAVHVTGHQDLDLFRDLDGEATSAIDIWRGIEEILDHHTPHGEEFEQGPRVAALLGDYGSNRGTQLRRIAWATATASLRGAETMILPVLVELEQAPGAQWSDLEMVERLVDHSLERHWPGATAIAQELLDGTEPRLRLIFNTDDGLPQREQRAWLQRLRYFIARYPQHQYVIGANPDSWLPRQFAGVDQHILILQPLARRRIRHFLHHLPENDPAGQPLLKRLDRYGLYDLAAVPWFMVKLMQQAREGAYPDSRTQMLGRVVEEGVTAAVDHMYAGRGNESLIASFNRLGLRGHLMQMLGTLAWRMQSQLQGELPVSEVFEALQEIRGHREYSLEGLLDALVTARLLATSGSDGIRFAYNRVQAFCCARAIVQRSDRDNVLDNITSTLGRLSRLHWWEEILVFTAGLMCSDVHALEPFLEVIIYGMNLLESERTFLAARCLSEAAAYGPSTPGVANLNATVTAALIWRLHSRNEPSSSQRSRSAALLGQIASQEAVRQLAETAYGSPRPDRQGEPALDYSNVRMAAVIGLLRMSASAQQVLLSNIDPVLTELLTRWLNQDVAGLIRWLNQSDNTSAQGLAALGLGDLHMQLKLFPERQAEAQAAIDALADIFLHQSMSPSTHWAVAYALATVDLPTVRDAVLAPFFNDMDAMLASSHDPMQQIKCMGYLIGLVRWQVDPAREFLLDRCIRDGKDANLAAVAIDALARLADKRDSPLLESIAMGQPPASQLPYFHRLIPRDQRYLQRKAIDGLAAVGDSASVAALRQSQIARAGWSPELEQALYRTGEEIFWREQARSRQR